MIVNVRGLSGSGKSTVVRELTSGAVETGAISSDVDGRRIATTYALPGLLRPLTVIGCYDRAGGGCDALRHSDGGLHRAVALAADAAARGHTVLLEGNQLSFDTAMTRRLSEGGELRIVLLLVPVSQCAENLRRRRRLPGSRLLDLSVRLEGEVRRLSRILPSLISLCGTALVPAAGPSAAVDLVSDWISAPGGSSAPPVR